MIGLQGQWKGGCQVDVSVLPPPFCIVLRAFIRADPMLTTDRRNWKRSAWELAREANQLEHMRPAFERYGVRPVS